VSSIGYREMCLAYVIDRYVCVQYTLCREVKNIKSDIFR